jgi:hypothetical protein
MLPVTKKVAGTPSADKTSSSCGVLIGCGPSSKVSEIVLVVSAA